MVTLSGDEGFFQEIIRMISDDRLVHSQFLLQKYLEDHPANTHVAYCFRLLAQRLGITELNAQITSPGRYLLIKSWGYGFWSDISHVLCQLLIAELTCRTPVIHWGDNSLYSTGNGLNAFTLYFEAINEVTLEDIQGDDFSFWPPKWNRQNIAEVNINKWSGSFSNISGIYFLGRDEDVLVSDFFTPLYLMLPWIPKSSFLHGLSLRDIYFYLIGKYLRPKSEILSEIDTFYSSHLEAMPFVSAHIRGSDKIFETRNLGEINSQYRQIIDRELAFDTHTKLFVMTDDDRILNAAKKYYGSNLVFTRSTRSSISTGVHHLGTTDKYLAGVEVIIDTYLAAKARKFIGNGTSNPSLIVSCMKKWPIGDIHLIGKNMFQDPRDFLYHSRLAE